MKAWTGVRKWFVYLFFLSLSCFIFMTAAFADEPTAGLISSWHADGNANDSAGPNNASFVGGASYANGISGQAFSLDGTSQYVKVATPSGLPVGSAPRTMSLWFKTPRDLTTSTESGLIQYGTDATGEMFGLITSGNAPSKLYFFGYNYDLYGTTTILPNTWYHGAVTYDGTTVRLYVNGRLESSSAYALNTVINPVNGLTIGNRPDLLKWRGVIDEVRIYNRALSAAEIANLAGFNFISQTAMPLSRTIVSNPVSVNFVSGSQSISISGGAYELNGSGVWTTTGGTVNSGDIVKMSQTSSSINSTSTTATLTIGSFSSDFTVTTAASGDLDASTFLTRGDDIFFSGLARLIKLF